MHLECPEMSLVLILDITSAAHRYTVLICTTDYGFACFSGCGEEGSLGPALWKQAPYLPSEVPLRPKAILKALSPPPLQPPVFWEAQIFGGQHFSAYPKPAINVVLNCSLGIAWLLSSFQGCSVFQYFPFFALNLYSFSWERSKRLKIWTNNLQILVLCIMWFWDLVLIILYSELASPIEGRSNCKV